MGEITASASSARPKRDKRAVTALKARFERHNWTLVALLFLVLLIFPALPFVEGWMVYQASLVVIYIMITHVKTNNTATNNDSDPPIESQ